VPLNTDQGNQQFFFTLLIALYIQKPMSKANKDNIISCAPRSTLLCAVVTLVSVS